jgi:hypothetical protein
MDLDISTADGKLIKVIKKSMKEKKTHDKDRTQTSSGLTAKFKFISKCMTKMENFAGSRKVAHILKV